jgi:hypothetical protein
MSDVKLHGKEDLLTLLGKPDTWKPPMTLDDFLACVRAVISTSKYKNNYLIDPEALEELRSIVVVKAKRIRSHPDLEECVDVAAYAYMIFDLLIKQDKENESTNRICQQ